MCHHTRRTRLKISRFTAQPPLGPPPNLVYQRPVNIRLFSHQRRVCCCSRSAPCAASHAVASRMRCTLARWLRPAHAAIARPALRHRCSSDPCAARGCRRRSAWRSGSSSSSSPLFSSLLTSSGGVWGGRSPHRKQLAIEQVHAGKSWSIRAFVPKPAGANASSFATHA